MPVSHKDITDPNIHEPKGVATATVGQVYVADGAGSGGWFTPVFFGWEDYNDSGSPQSLTQNVAHYLTNDATGGNTNITYKLPSSQGIWNPTLNQFEFNEGGLVIGDVLDIRVDVEFTTAGINHTLVTEMILAIGSGVEFSIPFDPVEYDTAGTFRKTLSGKFYIGSANVLNYPAKIRVTSDGSGDSVKVNGWFVKSFKREVEFV